MLFTFSFFFNSIFLGIGLAMDAVSVSLANGLNEPLMKKSKMCGISAIFAFFQALMPLIGWVCVHTVVQHFKSFAKLVPWIALLLLGYIGGKMLIEGIKMKDSCPIEKPGIGFAALLMQGVATSIDALSVGFTISDYAFPDALIASLIIAAVTFILCFFGIAIGKKFGTCISGKAGILGGVILIVIGLEIFIKGLI